MALDWDALVLQPAMDIFGEGQAGRPDTWPTYRPAGGSAFPLRGAVYDSNYKRVTDLGDGTTETAEHPVLGVRDSLFGGVQPGQGDQVYIPSVDQLYAVVEAEQDGHGQTLLILMEAE
ncbi:MAG: head-tail joining protein [Janthinobacterium lividum]